MNLPSIFFYVSNWRGMREGTRGHLQPPPCRNERQYVFIKKRSKTPLYDAQAYDDCFKAINYTSVKGLLRGVVVSRARSPREVEKLSSHFYMFKAKALPWWIKWVSRQQVHERMNGAFLNRKKVSRALQWMPYSSFDSSRQAKSARYEMG